MLAAGLLLQQAWWAPVSHRLDEEQKRHPVFKACDVEAACMIAFEPPQIWKASFPDNGYADEFSENELDLLIVRIPFQSSIALSRTDQDFIARDKVKLTERAWR
jgi:hypothetical protein